MSKNIGKITGIAGNMMTVAVEGNIIQNEIGYAVTGDEKLKAEVVKIQGDTAFMQVFESTKGLKIGDTVEFTGEMLSVELGPGILGMVYDGLQNPLNELAEEHGFFLKRGAIIPALNRETKWEFTPSVKPGETVKAGDKIGSVKEGIFDHKIFVPLHLLEEYTVKSVVEKNEYTVDTVLVKAEDAQKTEHEFKMYFNWPVKLPIIQYRDKKVPEEPMITQTRIIDTFFPVSKGGTYCIPGPFGAGKTVLQQVTSRFARVDIVIIAACGERAGEVVESRIAQFYERSGLVELNSGEMGSLTIGGTVSPAGGNFEEPVTQSTLKVVGAFHGLSRDRSNARRYPAIHPLESWSKYVSVLDDEMVQNARKILSRGSEVHQMMLVVGEDGTSQNDFITYLKSEFLDNVYLQQNSFDEIDGATSPERQKYIFKIITSILNMDFNFGNKQEARSFFNTLRSKFIDWNYIDMSDDKFKEQENDINNLIKEKSNDAESIQ